MEQDSGYLRMELVGERVVPMGRAIAEVLTFAVGIAISPMAIIAIILILFSRRARANGLAFLAGWVLALVVASAVIYVLSDRANAASSQTTDDSLSWGKIILGVLFFVLAWRTWRERPERGAQPRMPKWMGGIEALSPAAAFGLGVVCAGANPKNLALTAGAAAGVAQLGVSGADVVVALGVFVVLASVTIAGPVIYELVGGSTAQARLDELKTWLVDHNAAVMIVLFVVLGAGFVAKGLPPLTS